MADTIDCWKCGASLASLPQPFARAEVCPSCRADVRVCRQCVFFDTSRSKQCRETIVDEVSNKDRSNFCGYFKAKVGAYRNNDDVTARAKEELERLFGGKS